MKKNINEQIMSPTQYRNILCANIYAKLGRTKFNEKYPNGCSDFVEKSFRNEENTKKTFEFAKKHGLVTGDEKEFFKKHACDKFPNSQYCTNQQNQGTQNKKSKSELNADEQNHIYKGVLPEYLRYFKQYVDLLNSNPNSYNDPNIKPKLDSIENTIKNIVNQNTEYDLSSLYKEWKTPKKSTYPFNEDPIEHIQKVHTQKGPVPNPNGTQDGQTNIANPDFSCLSSAQAIQPGGPYKYTINGVEYYLEAGKADDGNNTFTHYYYCENNKLNVKLICDHPNSKVVKGKSGDPWEYKKIVIKDEKNEENVQYCTKKQTSDTWIHVNMALPKFMDAKVYTAIKDKVNFDSPDTDTSGGGGGSGTSVGGGGTSGTSGGGGTSGTSGGNVTPELGKTNPIIKMRDDVKTQFESKFTCINELKNPYYREVYNSTIQDYEPVVISREGENWLYHYGSGTLIEMTPSGRVVNVGKFDC